jgi:hypothetical protein
MENYIRILKTKIRVDPSHSEEFNQWRANLHNAIAKASGFLSLEIVCSPQEIQNEWVVAQRFSSTSDLKNWVASPTYATIMNELTPCLPKGDATAVQQEELEQQNDCGVTELIVTEVAPENIQAFRNWFAKIQSEEMKFPGFQGVHIQAPGEGKGNHWITLLHFNTIENLENWIKSPQRHQILEESKGIVTSFETHRVVSSFSGWFSSLAQTGTMPPVWKQTMLVLLVLFPIVMLEMKFLSPLTSSLNPSLAMFIGNLISVSLISWPMMPITIFFLQWWLSPQKNSGFQTLLGVGIIVALYLIEIAIFWNP